MLAAGHRVEMEVGDRGDPFVEVDVPFEADVPPVDGVNARREVERVAGAAEVLLLNPARLPASRWPRRLTVLPTWGAPGSFVATAEP